jgi:hypothetical protein
MKLVKLKGGEGSGHFNHAGIPGHQGGSLPSAKMPTLYSEWKDSLPDDVKSYLPDNSDEVTNRTFVERLEANKKLRTGKKSDYESDYGLKVDETITALTKATTTYSYALPNPIIVYRGINKSAVNRMSKNAKFTDRGFVYVTTDKSIADKYSGKKGAVISIELPAGTKCALGFLDQREFILPRNSQFEILEHSDDDMTARLI